MYHWMIGKTAKQINDSIQDLDAEWTTTAKQIIRASVTLLCHGDSKNAVLHDTVYNGVTYWLYHGLVLVVYPDDHERICVA